MKPISRVIREPNRHRESSLEKRARGVRNQYGERVPDPAAIQAFARVRARAHRLELERRRQEQLRAARAVMAGGVELAEKERALRARCARCSCELGDHLGDEPHACTRCACIAFEKEKPMTTHDAHANEPPACDCGRAMADVLDGNGTWWWFCPDCDADDEGDPTGYESPARATMQLHCCCT